MKRIFLGPQGPPSYIGKWTENGLRMIERWINTLVEFRGATADRDGSDDRIRSAQTVTGDPSRRNSPSRSSTRSERIVKRRDPIILCS